jgi:hypothetical protein
MAEYEVLNASTYPEGDDSDETNTCWRFRGPGASRYSQVRCSRYDAHEIARLLSSAYEAGKDARSAELLRLLNGVRKPR